MKTFSLSVLSALVLAGCQTAPTTTRIEAPKEVEKPIEQAVGAVAPGLVLIHQEAPPRVAPEQRSFRPEMDETLDYEFVRFRATGQSRGVWIEVESTEDKVFSYDAKSHCWRASPWGSRYKLRLYAHRDELSTVVTRDVEAAVAGTDDLVRIKASAVLLGKVGSGQYKIPFMDSLVDVALPNDAVGLSYKAPGKLSTEGMIEDSTSYTLKDTAIRVGNSEIVLDDFEYFVAGPKNIQGQSETTVVLSTRCVAVRGRAPTWKMEPASGLMGYGGLGMRGTGSSSMAEIKKGTPIFWPDGAKAGRVRVDHKIVADFETAPSGLLCPKADVAGGYPICFKEGDLNRGSP